MVLVNTNQQTANHYEALLPCASVDRTYVDQDAVHRFAGSLRSDQVVRSLLYKLSHLMGDVQAVHHGRIGKRLAEPPMNRGSSVRLSEHPTSTAGRIAAENANEGLR